MSVVVAASGSPALFVGPHTVRVLPAPRCEPPTDDELRAAGCDPPSMSAPQLPLDLRAGTRPHRWPILGRPVARPPKESAPMGADSPPDHHLDGAGPGAAASPANVAPTAPAPASPSVVPCPPGPPGLAAATRRLLAICVEVIGGFRPAAHLRPLCQPERFATITDQLSRPSGATTRFRGQRMLASQATSQAVSQPRHPATNGCCVRRVQLCQAAPGVAEVAVVLARRDQVWAMALRLEWRREQWLCTHLEVV